MRRSDSIRGDARNRGSGADRHAGFTVSDGRFTSRTATVTIDVAANDAPTASDATISAPFAGSAPVDLVAADPDGAALIWRIGMPAPVVLGTVPVGVNGSFALTVTVPTLTVAGVHTVRAFVGTVEAARATLTVDAAAAPVPPVAPARVLSATGGEVPVDLVVMASLLLMAGLLLVVRRRRRQA